MTRVALLTTELEARRREHSSVVGELEKSRRIVSELRKRDSSLNAEILRRERRHLAEVSRIASVLSEAQKTQLTRMAEKASVRHLLIKYFRHICLSVVVLKLFGLYGP